MAQYVYRRPPYPYYDMEGIESWLEDLITDGLWLDHEGYVFGLMQFRPGTPKKLKYRLEPIEKQSFLYLGQPKPPSDKALELYEEFGWEYLGTFYDFYIYRSMDENAVELNTDPTLQAQALAAVRRRNWYIFLFTALLSAACFYLVFFRGFPLIGIIQDDWRSHALLLAYLLIVPLYFLIPYFHVTSLQNKLAQGQTLTRNKNWRKGRFFRRILMALPWILYLVLQLTNVHSQSAIRPVEVNPDTLTPPPPFVTLAEIGDDRTVEYQGHPQIYTWSTPLTPVSIYWNESAWLHHAEETKWQGDLQAYYYETSSHWIAKELYREYVRKEEQILFIDSPGAAFSPADFSPSDYGFDELAVYDSYWGAIIIIRDGNTVIQATCTLHQHADSKLLYPLWLERIAETLT